MSFLKNRSAIPRTHWLHGVKTAVAAGLCYGITTFYNLEYGYWAVISTVIVMQVYVADSIRMCLYRLSGTIIGALMGIGALLYFPDTTLGRLFAVLLPVGICSFMTHYNPRYRMAAITAVIVIMTGFTAPDKAGFGFSRIIEIAIGICCAFAVSILVFPVRVVDVLKENINKQALECCEKYDILTRAFLNGQKRVGEALLEDLTRKVWKNHELFQSIKQHEALIYHRKFSKNMKRIISTMDKVVEHLRTMTRTLNVTEERGFDIIMEKELTVLADRSKAALMDLVENDGAAGTDRLSQAIAATEERLHTLRSQGVTARFDLHKLEQFYSFYHSMHYLAEDLAAAVESNKNR
ncbi:MAG: FUSC family protein [Desulfobacteraceae bacterium]|nr:FUSC family protein [Desulfobacteraceae bacterium]